MRVIFHTDWLGSGRGYGLGRYAQEMLRALCAVEPALKLTAVSVRGERALSDCAPGATSSLSTAKVRHGRVAMFSWAAVGMPSIERWANDAQIVHSVELDYPVATRLPWIVTVHDLGPLTHPEYFGQSRPWLKRRAIVQAIRKAAAIVAVSQATAEAIEWVAGRSLGSRMRVVPEGVTPEFFEREEDSILRALPDTPPPGAPYFLWTGSLNPRKNVTNVIKAFELAANSIPHHLVLAGGLGWTTDKILEGIRSSTVRERIHRPGHVTDAQLRALYGGSTAFVYASLMEGFGLPILEAMASQCAVITSNISSMPEVAGDAALLVDPVRPEAIAEAMVALGSDPGLRRTLIDKGLARARSFTWSRSAGEIINLYRGALQR